MPNPNISNGTCYFGKDNETRGDFVPCGNIAFGNWPCCALGDSCLGFEGANACYDENSGNAYMAGCTDQSYVDKTCPQKLGFKDQEWVGMIHCDTESNGDTDWGGCKVDPANATDLFKLPNESCDDYCATTLWVGAADIPSFAVLPTSNGGSMTWISNFNPTSTSRAPGTPGTATPTATQATTESTPGLSTGAKAGIGVGCAVGGLIIIGMFIWCCLARRKRKAQKNQANAQQQQQPQRQETQQAYVQAPYPPGYHAGSVSTAHSPTSATLTPSSAGYDPQQWQHSPMSKPPHWVPTPSSDAFTGFKNELPADSIQPVEMASHSTTEEVTVPAPFSPTDRDIERAGSSASGTTQPRDQRPDVEGGYYLSQQSTGSDHHRAEGEEYDHRRGPPSEMEA